MAPVPDLPAAAAGRACRSPTAGSGAPRSPRLPDRSPHWADRAIGPRQRLRFDFTRRELFTALATELRIIYGRSQGGEAWRLADLGRLPDAALERLVPIVVAGCRITETDGHVFGQVSATAAPKPLFPKSPAALEAFNQFNGLTPIGAIVRHVAAATGWSHAESHELVRGLFLDLVVAGVCVPKWP